MSIGTLKSEGDLRRFIRGVLAEPGAVEPHRIVGLDDTIAAAVAGGGVLLDTDGTLSANSDAVAASQKATRTYADTKAPLSHTHTLAAVTDAGTVASLASDTDGTLAANSDSRVATQKATKSYADKKRALNKWRPLGVKVGGPVATSLGSGNKYWILPGAAANVNLALATAASNSAIIFNWVPGDQDETGLTTKLLLRCSAVLGSSPAIVPSVSLYSITAAASSTLNTIVSTNVAATVPFSGVASNASTTLTAETEFTAPSAGRYGIGFELSGTPSFAFHLEVELLVRNV